MNWEVKRIRAVKNTAISWETFHHSRVCHRKSPLTMKFGQLKVSQQKSQTSSPRESGPDCQVSTGEGQRMKNWGGKQVWGLRSDGLLFPCFLKHFPPLFHLGPCTHSNSSTNAAKLYGLVGAAWRDISWLSYPQQCAAQTVVCFVYNYTLSSDSHVKYLQVFSLLVNNILSLLGCHFSCLIRAVASWHPAYLSWLDKCCM